MFYVCVDVFERQTAKPLDSTSFSVQTVALDGYVRIRTPAEQVQLIGSYLAYELQTGFVFANGPENFKSDEILNN